MAENKLAPLGWSNPYKWSRVISPCLYLVYTRNLWMFSILVVVSLFHLSKKNKKFKLKVFLGFQEVTGIIYA